MKKVYLFMFTAFAVLSFSCFSLPNPSDKKPGMLYANLKCFVKEPASAELEEYSSKNKLEATLTIRNVEKKKTYTLESNSKGEIVRTGLPLGEYLISRIEVKFYYFEDQICTVWSEPDPNAETSKFSIKKGVTNLGIIKVLVDMDKKMGGTSWAGGANDARKAFAKNYPKSLWNDEPWYDRFL